jgi:hypothetical protein
MMSDRQAVVFVRINNMVTLEVERQKTFVVDVYDPDDIGNLDELIADALKQATAQAKLGE